MVLKSLLVKYGTYTLLNLLFIGSKIFFGFVLFVCTLFISGIDILAVSSIDLTIVGPIKYGDGAGRMPIGLADIFRQDFKINHIPVKFKDDFSDVQLTIKNILKNKDCTPGKVAILTHNVWNKSWGNVANLVPNDSLIKIAYSMIESTSIPTQWVEIFNHKFDLVVVPDFFYVDVYRNAGVNIPIFVLPHGIYIEDFLDEPIKGVPSVPFVFGTTASFVLRKNQALLIEAFHAEFGNDPNVKLKLHGRGGSRSYIKKITKQIKSKHVANIKLINTPFSDRQLHDFFKSLDCYVLLSKGEGFSVTPREALALGIPCIISDNTAHKTICKSGYVYAVSSSIEAPANYTWIFDGYIGNNFNCKIEDARKALRDVYTDYAKYVRKAEEGRNWVKQYLWKNVKGRFCNLIKPKQIILGDDNVVTDDYLMTTSEKLYKKYHELVMAK